MIHCFSASESLIPFLCEHLLYELYLAIHYVMCLIVDVRHRALLDMLLFLLLAVLSQQLSPVRSVCQQGDFRQLSCRRRRQPIKAERCLCHALSTQTLSLIQSLSKAAVALSVFFIIGADERSQGQAFVLCGTVDSWQRLGSSLHGRCLHQLGHLDIHALENWNT